MTAKRVVEKFIEDAAIEFRKIRQKATELANTFIAYSKTGEFRVKSLRRTLIGFWFVAVFLTAILLCTEIYGLLFTNPDKLQQTDSEFFVYLVMYLEQVGVLNLLCDLWVAGALYFLFIEARKASERPPRIKSIFFAFILVLGRLSAFFWSLLLALIPASGWFFIFWPFKYILLPPALLLLTGMLEIIGLFFSLTVLIGGVVWFPLKVYQSVLNIANGVAVANNQKTEFFMMLFRFWSWFTGRPLPPVQEPPDDSKGARFASTAEVREQQTEGGFAFGHLNGEPLFLSTEKHIFIQASTRSGKGVALIIPHLLRYNGSAFIFDPKGENARATGRQRTKINDKVHYLDPFGISGKESSRFNPLSRFTLDNMEAESKALAAALVLGEEGNKRDHWTASAQQLLAAVILHVFTSGDVSPGQKDLPTVRRLLLSDINGVLKSMVHSEAADGLLSNLARSFLDTPDKEFGSILSSAQRETEILDNPFITRSLAASGSGPEVDFSQWHNSTMSVYLCISAPKFPVFNRWLRLVLTAALDEMTDTLNPPALPVCFMLDELATLGHLQIVENAVGLAAGYGIQLVTVFQDVAQMKDLYKGRWASFIGNAGVRVLFNLDDYDTAQYWSKFVGGHLVQTQNIQQDKLGLSTGQSKGEAMRLLLSPEEIMLQFAKNKMLVLAQGARPIVTDRVAYWKDSGLAGLWDDPRPKRN